MVSRNIWNSSSPIPVTQGGVEQSTYINGQLLIGNSTGNTLTKSTLTDGTNCTIINGAGSSTINFSNPDKWVLIQTQSASSSSNISFTGLSSYGGCQAVVLSNIIPSTNGTVLRMYVSNNNGSTYFTTNYTACCLYSSYNSSTLNNINSTTYIPLSAYISSSYNYSGVVFIYNMNEADYFVTNGYVNWYDTSLGTSTIGITQTTSKITGMTALKFQMSSGNIASGKISLYWIKRA